MTGEDIGALVVPLIEGLAQDPPWQGFLDALRMRLEADYASLVFRPLTLTGARSRVVHLYSGSPFPPEIARHHRENLGRMDPMPHHDMEEGRCYRLDELLRDGEPDHQTYLSELLLPAGMAHMRMIRIAAKDGISAWITVSRRTCDFDSAAEALLVALMPHLRAALGGFLVLERTRMEGAVAGEAVRRMNFGWFTLDGGGRVLDSDLHGSAMLARGGQLARGRDGRLVAADPGVRRQLGDALAELAGRPEARPRALVLSREPWIDLLIVPAQPRLLPGTGARGAEPALVCYIHADNWTSADRCDQLAELFDLSPSEARLALALSRGQTLREAAPELGLTVESARTYSKRIFAKTGARGQTDLVRFIHRSILALA